MVSIRPVRRIGHAVLIVLAALELAFEELVWNAVGAVVARVARLRLVARLEARLARLPPYPAMALFVIPFAAVLVCKLYGTYLIAGGHAGLGVMVILLAKIVGTMIMTRLFTVCRPQLMRIAWFARLYAGFMAFKARIMARLHAMPAWIALARALAALRSRLAGWRRALRRWLPSASAGPWRARWRAARRVLLRR